MSLASRVLNRSLARGRLSSHLSPSAHPHPRLYPAMRWNSNTTPQGNTPPSALHANPPPGSPQPSSSNEPPPKPKFAPPITPPPPPPDAKGMRLPVRATLYLLFSSSLVLTLVGVYDFYSMFQTWPKEMREDLRAAIKFKRDGEWKGAEIKFRSAIATANSLDEQTLSPGRVLKVSGLWIALASMFEQDTNEFDKAYVAYLEGFKACLTNAETSSVEGRDGPERMRAVAISQKLGEVALKIADLGPNSAAIAAREDRLRGETRRQTYAERVLSKGSTDSKGAVTAASPQQEQSTEEDVVIPFETRKEAADAAEKHLVWSVEELLRLTVPSEIQQNAANQVAAAGGSPTDVKQQETGETDTPTSVSLAELDLPPWVAKSDILSSLESLGSFYARAGETQYAIPLFLQALEILLPTNPAMRAKRPTSSVTVNDRCQASVIMNNISETFLSGKEVDDAEFKKAQDAHGGRVGQATAWAKKGLDLVQNTNGKVGWGLEGEAAKNAGVTKVEGVEDVGRTDMVRKECLFAEVVLLTNLATLSQMADDKCAARNYLQRAYRLANQEGFREARNKVAGILRTLERR